MIYRPERVLMEWNGMWNQDELKLPDDWAVYQQITIIDGSTFELYRAEYEAAFRAYAAQFRACYHEPVRRYS